MTAAKKEEQQTTAEEKPAQQPKRSLFSQEMDRYRNFLDRGFETASQYYGFTLFHSLTPEEKVKWFEDLGFEPENPEDFYNLGVMAAHKEEYDKAAEFFEKTISLAADFEQAYYNLALMLEKLGKEKAALEQWEVYYEFLDEDSSEAIKVHQHMEELKSSIK